MTSWRLFLLSANSPQNKAQDPRAGSGRAPTNSLAAVCDTLFTGAGAPAPQTGVSSVGGAWRAELSAFRNDLTHCGADSALGRLRWSPEPPASPHQPAAVPPGGGRSPGLRASVCLLVWTDRKLTTIVPPAGRRLEGTSESALWEWLERQPSPEDSRHRLPSVFAGQILRAGCLLASRTRQLPALGASSMVRHSQAGLENVQEA